MSTLNRGPLGNAFLMGRESVVTPQFPLPFQPRHDQPGRRASPAAGALGPTAPLDRVR